MMREFYVNKNKGKDHKGAVESEGTDRESTITKTVMLDSKRTSAMQREGREKESFNMCVPNLGFRVQVVRNMCFFVLTYGGPWCVFANQHGHVIISLPLYI